MQRSNRQGTMGDDSSTEQGSAAEWTVALEELRAETAQLREQLGLALDDVRHRLDELGEMRASLETIRDELVQTMGGANRWFVQVRDELFERLEDLRPTLGKSSDAELEAALRDLQTEVQAMGATLLALRREGGRPAGGRRWKEQAGAKSGASPGETPTYEELIRMLVTGTFQS